MGFLQLLQETYITVEVYDGKINKLTKYKYISNDIIYNIHNNIPDLFD